MTCNILTLPYYAILRLRHFLYDRGFLHSRRTGIPSIGIGNITVGGTGKTPHCEMLLSLLSGKYRTAVISRGYGRRSRGLREVMPDDSATVAGDEPLQMKRKFPGARVIVSESREKAVEMLRKEGKTDLIVFDDVFQHRSIIPDVSVLLVDYNRPYYKDSLLPFGRLRDIPYAARRADMFIVTKIPSEYIPDDSESSEFSGRLKCGDRPLFFSRIKYLDPKPVFPDDCEPRYRYSKSCITFSAIANDSLLRYELGERYREVGHLKFRDHRFLSRKDIASITSKADRHVEAVIFTTEKDAVRMERDSVPQRIRRRMFYLPISAEIRKSCSVTDSNDAMEQDCTEILTDIIEKKLNIRRGHDTDRLQP